MFFFERVLGFNFLHRDTQSKGISLSERSTA